MKNLKFKDYLPEYPSTLHLPWKPNSKGDKIATDSDAAIIFENKPVFVQEKIDGANCGMAFIDDHPVVRSRTKILRKGQELKNPSKAQFGSAWNWMYEHKKCFDNLSAIGPYSVYGEWLVQQHGMYYDALQDWFVAYDVYDWEKREFVAPYWADNYLRVSGFEVIGGQIMTIGTKLTYPLLQEMANKPSCLCENSQREGIILKVADGENHQVSKFIIAKFKMVREGFDQGCLLGEEIKRNKIRKRDWSNSSGFAEGTK